MKSVLLIALSCLLLAAARPIAPHTQTPPSVYFLPNSAVPRTDSDWYQQREELNSLEDAVDTIVHMLQENPHMVISAIGYCDYLEDDRSTLALARASKVRDMLIAKGVPPDQVEVQERGEQFRITKEQFATMKDPKEIEAAHAVNRYVNYIALRFDRKH